MGIKAETHSDDHRVEIEFDAAAWFAAVPDVAILALARDGWGGTETADTVAERFRNGATAPLFRYLRYAPPMGGDPVGFECHVDEGEALAWLREHRPALAEILDTE